MNARGSHHAIATVTPQRGAQPRAGAGRAQAYGSDARPGAAAPGKTE